MKTNSKKQINGWNSWQMSIMAGIPATGVVSVIHILKLIMLAPSYLILNGLNVFAVKWYSTYRHRVRIINLLLLCCTPMVYLIVFFLYHVNTCYSCYLLPFIILPRLCIASHTHDLMKMTSFTFNRHKVSQSILTHNTWFYFIVLWHQIKDIAIHNWN